MRVSVVLPYLAKVFGQDEASNVSGAGVATNLALRRYANDPAIEALELYLAPRDLYRGDLVQVLAKGLLDQANAGKGKLEIHSLYALPDVWADGQKRMIHTEDLHLLARDRDLRDRFAKGPTAIASDCHCMGHRGIVESLRILVARPPVAFDRIYAPCRATAKSIEATLSMLGSPGFIEVVLHPRMTDIAGLEPCVSEVERCAARRSMGLPEKGEIALTVGRMTPSTKGDLIVLVEVFAENSGPDQHLMVAGREEATGYASLVSQVAKRLGVADRVHILGGFEPKARGEIYKASDFLIFPADSGNEVFGLAASEAMACGLPVLGTDWDGLKDTIEHGVTGFKIPTFEPPDLGRFDDLSWAVDEQTTLLLRAQATVLDRAAFGRHMSELFNDAELRGRMGKAALDAMSSRLNPDRLFATQLDGFRDQLAHAAWESCTDAAKRKEWAFRHPLETPVFEQFEGYGSQSLFSSGRRFLTNMMSLEISEGKYTIELFPEVQAVLPARIIQFLLLELKEAKTSDELMEACLAHHIPSDLAVFGLAVLCKRGHISFID